MGHREEVMTALRSIRPTKIGDEVHYLHGLIAEALDNARITHWREFCLGPRSRIDFLTDRGFGIEVKKARPNVASALRQIQRYAADDRVTGLVLVVERAIPVPHEINGKPVMQICLRQNFGVAI